MRKLKLDELHRKTITEYKSASTIPITVILDNIRSGMNVGSVFRSCDAFRIHEVVLCGITAHPPHKEILKTAIGANESVKWRHVKNITDILEELNSTYTLIGIEQTTKSVQLQDYKVDANKKYALIFGNEVEGISAASLPYLDSAIEIPQFGTKHSLNIAVCAGIALWHFAQPFLADLR